MNGMYPRYDKPTDNATSYSHDEPSVLGSFIAELDRVQRAQKRRHDNLMVLITAWIIATLVLTCVWAFMI